MSGEQEWWIDVCALDDIWPDTGVAALVGGEQLALVRVGDGAEVYAVGQFDPFSKAFVMSRGIVGDRAGEKVIASPMYKQRFALASGVCLDDEAVRLPIWPVRVRGGRVEVAVAKARAA